MSKRASHCIIDGATKEFVCKHCGSREAQKLPAPISEFVASIDAFTNKHGECKPTNKE